MQTIGVIEGDGVGPEVMSEALHVLELVSRQDQLAFHIERFDLGAERYLRTGEKLSRNGFASVMPFFWARWETPGCPQACWRRACF